MSLLRRMMMNGFDIDTIPSSRKIYYTASKRITPKENSLGSKVQFNIYNATTMSGVLVTANDITTIGDSAFKDCYDLTSIVIPEGVTSIGGYAFYRCSSLTSITIPEGVTLIENYSFYNCYSLTSITIPDSVKSIGEHALYDCRVLVSVVIPKDVTNIGNYAFAACGYLVSVYCKAVTPPILGYLGFSFNAQNRKIYVPMESIDVYKNAQNWNDYADAIEGYEYY